MNEQHKKYLLAFLKFISENEKYFRVPGTNSGYSDYMYDVVNHFKCRHIINTPIFYKMSFIKKYKSKIVYLAQIFNEAAGGYVFSAIFQISRNLHIIIEFRYCEAEDEMYGSPHFYAKEMKLINKFISSNKDMEMEIKSSPIGFNYPNKR